MGAAAPHVDAMVAFRPIISRWVMVTLPRSFLRALQAVFNLRSARSETGVKRRAVSELQMLVPLQLIPRNRNFKTRPSQPAAGFWLGLEGCLPKRKTVPLVACSCAGGAWQH